MRTNSLLISGVPTWNRCTAPVGRLRAHTLGRVREYPGGGRAEARVCRSENEPTLVALSCQLPPPTTVPGPTGCFRPRRPFCRIDLVEKEKRLMVPFWTTANTSAQFRSLAFLSMPSRWCL